VQHVAGGHVLVYAQDVPPFSYQRLQLRGGAVKPISGPRVSDDGRTIENSQFRVTIDPSHGVVTSIFDKQNNRESIAAGGSGNRLEVHWEQPNGMSAWSIGKIEKVEPLTGPVELKVNESGAARATVSWERKFGSTILRQTVSMAPLGPPEFSMATEWKELGAADKPCPFLKVAFDVNADAPKLTCQIPYGTIEKPTDGTELPALKFADLAGAAGGAALINDCKHGYSATGNTIRLSLIRSSYYPDPHPNDRPQLAKWVFLPHAGDWRDGHVLAAAEAFNHPLWMTAVKPNPAGTLPEQSSLLQVTGGDDIVVTGVKRAEDDDALVVRFYESDGKAATPALDLSWAKRNVSTVNLIEDALKDAKPLAALRPHEIRTIKVATGDVVAPAGR